MSGHEMVPAACPGGMQCVKCLAYATEIGFVLGPICPEDKLPKPPPPDRITALEAENARLREALEPFAKAADDAERFAGGDGPMGAYLDYTDLDAARATLKEKG